MITTIIIKQSQAKLSLELLDGICDPKYAQAKKGTISTETNTNDYYIIPSELRIANAQHTDTQYFNALMEQVQRRDYNFVMIDKNK